PPVARSPGIATDAITTACVVGVGLCASVPHAIGAGRGAPADHYLCPSCTSRPLLGKPERDRRPLPCTPIALLALPDLCGAKRLRWNPRLASRLGGAALADRPVRDVTFASWRQSLGWLACASCTFFRIPSRL